MSLNWGRDLTNDEIESVSGGECYVFGLRSPITISLAGTSQSFTYAPPIWVICRESGTVAAVSGTIVP